ncbi:unnamed protein product [Paramecium sonneborni]|uniref:Uncharacterized protein n=1 Tax=Paramecium sonneborni TaxID=65129 RepID=A0A8S1K2P8_9CILI|nr:unnamed protein product [Paramecium sonneborni]
MQNKTVLANEYQDFINLGKLKISRRNLSLEEKKQTDQKLSVSGVKQKFYLIRIKITQTKRPIKNYQFGLIFQ